MSASSPPVTAATPFWRRKPVLVAAALLAVFSAFALVRSRAKSQIQPTAYFEVKRGDFLISIVEGGNIEAVNEVVVRSEVEGTARIIYIVPEGTTVKKGDLLVELDSSSSQDAVNQQQINVEKAQFAVIQAEQQLEIQKSMVESEISAAELKYEFAKSDLEKFEKGEAAQLLRDAQIEITNVLENLKIAEEKLGWTEKLYEKGFETKANLDRDRLSVSQTKLRLEQAQKKLWMLENFDLPKKRRTLEAAVEDAKDDLERVKLQGQRRLAQYQADVQTQKSTLDLSKKKLERDLRQLANTKIYAPQDGLVVYAGGGGDRRFSSESMIEEGAVVRYRQEIIKLPDVSEYKVTVKVHESHVNQLSRGQPAYVVLDAMPDRRFQGAVNRVAPLPDTSSRWANPNLKVYATEILILEPVPNVKPGVSARAEIIITNLKSVLTVPIQCVTTRKGKQVVFLADNPTVPVPVNVGMYNTKFIEITSGLKEGDRVLLSPPYDAQEKDLAGAILGKDEKAEGLTNTPPERLNRATPENGAENGGAGFMEPGAGRGMRGERGEGAGMFGPGAGRNGGAGMGGEADGPGAGFGPGGMGPGGQPGQGRGGPRFNREEMMKRFDTNGDGELDENEQAAMREAMRAFRRPGGTNAPAGFPGPRPDGGMRPEGFSAPRNDGSR
ncbi:efflux RND transporter periplasmic adaptor subunit [Fontisphaera persica]|uniref:efflux RND transporter periplasmic adaptor subunit n=1 Tax=Fontisphaera persica TaxID=2974023 RepID=UPI0024BF83DF|nr:efflux RND transporter periplasmic adaptor subunit [Fontisphaera persica]WCJ59325.1 efflux RND transporter periplasmic adaptor subunit [Fontisphaera persica]